MKCNRRQQTFILNSEALDFLPSIKHWCSMHHAICLTISKWRQTTTTTATATIYCNNYRGMCNETNQSKREWNEWKEMICWTTTTTTKRSNERIWPLYHKCQLLIVSRFDQSRKNKKKGKVKHQWMNVLSYIVTIFVRIVNNIFFGNGFDLCRPSIGKLTRRNDKEKIGKFIADNVTMSLDVRAYDSRWQ